MGGAAKKNTTMTNFIQDGSTLDYTNAGSAISAGAVVVIGKLVGIAQNDIAASTGTGVVVLEGVFNVPKNTSLAITQGDQLFWDTTPGEVTKTPTDYPIGTAHESAGSSDTTVNVKLLQGGDSTPSAAVVAALTDNSGGTAADGTIGVITSGTPASLAAQGTINGLIADAIAELATKQNAVLTALKNAGLMASA